MNTPHTSPVVGGAQVSEGRSLALIIWAFVLLVFGLFAFNSSFGPTTERTINPAVSGAPRPSSSPSQRTSLCICNGAPWA